MSTDPEATMKPPDMTSLMSPRHKRIAIWTASCATLAFFFSILALPAIVKHQAEKQILAITGRVASISTVSFNPFGMTLTIKGFRFLEPD